MSRDVLIQRIKKKAKQDQKKRRDPRFLDTMGFLIAKGFLKTNQNIFELPNKRLRISDAVWAGINVEHRILEVLPAAVLRLGKHFDLDPVAYPELHIVVDQLRRRCEKGRAFCAIPYSKLKVWADFPLRDRRVRTVTAKKRMKTFRLDPLALARLAEFAKERGCSETEILEELLLKSNDQI